MIPRTRAESELPATSLLDQVLNPANRDHRYDPELWQGELPDGSAYVLHLRNGIASLGFGANLDDAACDAATNSVGYCDASQQFFFTHSDRWHAVRYLLAARDRT